jgi:hypothetical protein
VISRLKVSSLLVVAALISPFTLLRFGLLGVGELIFALVFVQQITKGLSAKAFRAMYLTRFWLGFLIVSVIGLLANAWILDRQTSTWPQILFDTGAYVFVFACCYCLERLATHTPFDVGRFTRSFYLASGVVFSALYVLSFFVDSIFGLPLKYYGYFVPLAENLHQISMSLVALPFIGLQVAAGERRGMRLVCLSLVLLFAVMTIATGSAKAALALIAGAVAMVYSAALSRFGRRFSFQINLLFAAMGVAALSLIDWVKFASVLFEEEDVGNIRSYLYTHAAGLVSGSPLVGRGPGPHMQLDWRFVDAHETFLTVLLQSGLIGLTLFIVLVFRLYRATLYQPPLFAAFSALMIYAAGGDILRRLPAWICLFIVLYWSRDLSERKRRGVSAFGGALASNRGVVRTTE